MRGFFKPHMQHVARPIVGVPRGGFRRETSVFEGQLMKRRALSLLVACALVGCQAPPSVATAAAPAGASPRFTAGGPNADEYGAQQGYPVAAIDRPRFYVGSFSHQDQLLESRPIRRADTPWRLNRAAVEPTFSYRYDGQDLTLDDYLKRNPTTGLLIARGDTILVERYQYSRNDHHRFTSASIAKTVTAMLIGIAIDEGKIRSVNDVAATYVPALADTEYGRTSLRHLLQMSSGVRFEEGYSGADDVARLWLDTVLQQSAGGVAAVKPFNERVRWGGAVFSYASAETQVQSGDRWPSIFRRRSGNRWAPKRMPPGSLTPPDRRRASAASTQC
jgi:CubicO group peptidase (beta-lactamase class C family)